MGFTPNQQQNNPNRQLNSTQIISVVVFAMSAVFVAVSIFRGNKDTEDFISAIFSLTFVVDVMIAFVSIIFKSGDLFDFIELFEKELTDRKCESK